MEERIARDDWRAPIDKPVVIWSKESQWHPDFGKDDEGVGGEQDRVSVTSRYMSFAILGSVVAFVFYAYLSHIMYAKKMKRREERVIKLSSLMIKAGYDTSTLNLPQIVIHDEFDDGEIEPSGSGERRRSILNLFKGFRL
uniref:Uncharacterized protein n=1 Tax=Plectus sambesii TaxID=2011161 RepID=A0A914WY77_9BILA